jgi:septum formation inhibitor MinC
MFVNPAYNHGKPYFINFRPILHNTRRLSDEELDKYNQYNDILDDLEYQIEQLEQEKIDVFDFNMELKLMKDKLMTGNFSVVDIYLEGLKPRVEKEWQKLGKKPKKRELQLVSAEAIQKSVQEAQKSRAEFEKQEAATQVKVQKEEVKENVDTKIVQPLTFDNGIMISSLKELKEVLPNLDDDVFKVHVNDTKNDIAKWISDNFSPEDGSRLQNIKTKSEMVKGLQSVGKSKSTKVAASVPAKKK